MSETVGFTGSRNYVKHHFVTTFVNNLAEKYPDITVISGGRGNVDVEAELAAADRRLAVVSYRPTETGIEIWKNEAGFRGPLKKVSDMIGRQGFVPNCFFRNQFIAGADRVVGFWDLSSHGTQDTLERAYANGRQVFVYDLDGVLVPDERAREIVARVGAERGRGRRC